MVDIIDAHTHFDTVDRTGVPPARYRVASLVVVNKLDRVPDAGRGAAVAKIESRVRELNPHAHVVGAVTGRIDPALLYDVSARGEEPGQLSLRDLLLDPSTPSADAGDHPVHADSVTVTGDGHVDPDALFDLLEHPPAGVYRLKGVVAVRYRSTVRYYVVNLVGTTVHVATAPGGVSGSHLVAIGMHLDDEAVGDALRAALHGSDTLSASGIRRLQRYRRLSI